MRNASALLVLFLVVAAGVTSPTQAAWTWETLDYPGAWSTQISGIDGDRIVGYYDGGDGSFLYGQGGWERIVYPGSDDDLTWGSTWARGISGNNIVGQYKLVWAPSGSEDGNFLYDGHTWSRLEFEDVLCVQVTGIWGSSFIGTGTIQGKEHAFLYDGTTLTYLDYPPGAIGNTWLTGISSSGIVGAYATITTNRRGFLYNAGTWTTFDHPGADQTIPSGISGSSIVGNFYRQGEWHGFLYDGTTYTTIDFPGAVRTSVSDVSGNRVVGYYTDISNQQHGFLLIVPEPMSLALLAAGGVLTLRRRLT